MHKIIADEDLNLNSLIHEIKEKEKINFLKLTFNLRFYLS